MPCTTLLVGKKASYDGSTLVARNEDSGAGDFTAKKFIVVHPSDQPKVYKSVLSHVEIPLPNNPMRYTCMPDALNDKGIWGAAGVNELNVSMTATETITSNERVLAADPLVKYIPAKGKEGDVDYTPEVVGGIGEEDIVTLVLPYIKSAREGVLRLGEILEKYGTYEMNGIAFQDIDEIWWLETIGGHHWIAKRVKDDEYVVMPNQLGIDSFDLKDAFDKLPADVKAEFQPTIDEVAKDAESFNLGENGKYALAWIKLWVNGYNAQTDDGPICTTLTSASATDQCGLLVYSKLRSIEESSETSVNNIKVAAYEDGYQGIGGFGYCHYLFLTKNSPLPWTAAAFIAYMTCTEKGFSAWGKDMGGYSSNPDVMTATEKTFNHAQGGYVDGVDKFPSKDDRGYDWWTTKGHLVLEDPEYCASVAFTVGSWIETLDKFNGNTSK